jgi:hypothetical protein
MTRRRPRNGACKTGAASANSTCGPAVSRGGDVWLLGAHQLTCGDLVDDDGYAAVDAAIRRWQKSTGIWPVPRKARRQRRQACGEQVLSPAGPLFFRIFPSAGRRRS